MLLMIGVLFLLVLGGGGLGLLTYAQRTQKRFSEAPPAAHVTENRSSAQSSAQSAGHVRDLIPLDSCIDGIITAGGRFYLAARVTGTNFSVIAEAEQEAKEEALIRIVNNIDYQVKFISTAVVSDMDAAVGRVEDFIGRLDAMEAYASSLSAYASMYVSVVADMRASRKVLSNQSWLVLGYAGADDSRQVLRERMELLRESLRGEAGVVLTPVTDEVEALDLVHQVIVPGRIAKPSDQLGVGSGEFLHTSEREALRFMQQREAV